MKRKLLLLGVLFLLFYLFFDPVQALEASKEGLGLWLNTLLPTLLPFLILSGLLIRMGAVRRLLSPFAPLWKYAFGLTPYGAYACLLGMLCGYPMGAKLTADLYSAQKIGLQEAKYLLTFANNASPMFLSTYLVLYILERPNLTLPTFGIVYACSYLCSLTFRFYYQPMLTQTLSMASIPQNSNTKETSCSNSADASIMNGFETITKLGGYILLFSLLGAAIQTFWHSDSLLLDFLLSLTEISTGLHRIKDAALSFPLKYAIATSATSFGGLCILAQTRSVIHEAGLPLSPYLAGKLLNLILTFGVSLLIAQIV